MRAPPGSEAPVPFALVVGEGRARLAEAARLDSTAARGRPDPLGTATRLPTSVGTPSPAARHAAVFLPASARAASLSASAGSSPNEDVPSPRRSIAPPAGAGGPPAPGRRGPGFPV